MQLNSDVSTRWAGGEASTWPHVAGARALRGAAGDDGPDYVAARLFRYLGGHTKARQGVTPCATGACMHASVQSKPRPGVTGWQGMGRRRARAWLQTCRAGPAWAAQAAQVAAARRFHTGAFGSAGEGWCRRACHLGKLNLNCSGHGGAPTHGFPRGRRAPRAAPPNQALPASPDTVLEVQRAGPLGIVKGAAGPVGASGSAEVRGLGGRWPRVGCSEEGERPGGRVRAWCSAAP
jgi:hypothetical protein